MLKLIIIAAAAFIANEAFSISDLIAAFAGMDTDIISVALITASVAPFLGNLFE